MKHTIAIGLVSLSAIAAACYRHPDWRWLWIWVAISFGWVALGYAGIGARVFAKRPDGRVPWAIKLLLWPFMLLKWLVWHIYRLVIAEDPYHKIDDKLFVGRRLLSSEVLEEFDYFVDLTSEFDEPEAIRSKPSYHNLPVLDGSVPSISALEESLDLVKDGKVYVHCAQGHGRAGLFAVALLFRRGRISTLDEGIELLKSKRPGVGLNRDQCRFMVRFISQAKTLNRTT